MLERTFLHVPSIGETREGRLWAAGYTDWSLFRARHPAGALRELVIQWLDRDLAAENLPPAHAWRLFPGARRVLYLDIETTGLRAGGDAITCIGTYDGRRVRAYVQGVDLDRFPEEVVKADLLVTYNGACFDLPFLQTAFPRLRLGRMRHVDLRYPLARLGLKGGLKGVERQLGIRREAAIAGLGGYDAVLLWEAHRQGHPRALETLIRYCLEDVVNLEPLMVEVCNRMAARLPIVVPRQRCGPRPAMPCRADVALARRLARGGALRAEEESP